MRLATKSEMTSQGALAILVNLDRYVGGELVRSDEISFWRLDRNKVYSMVGLLDDGIGGRRIIIHGYGKPNEIGGLVKEAKVIGCSIHVQDRGYDRRRNR
ncbi:MAG: hypothetical protein IIA87_01580 [Nanoarchaeota archaeon]|nr:hypothetical protein [Nanoarchaeota archaeon]